MADKKEASVRDIFEEINTKFGSNALGVTREILASFAKYGVGADPKNMDPRLKPGDRVILDLASKVKEGKLNYDFSRREVTYLDKDGTKQFLTNNDPLLSFIVRATVVVHGNLPSSFTVDQKRRAIDVDDITLGGILIKIFNEVGNFR